MIERIAMLVIVGIFLFWILSLENRMTDLYDKNYQLHDMINKMLIEGK